jgi:environmental stress-induced protein Ves
MHWQSITNFESMPWKNGGGTTVQFAIYPEDATLSNFVWRFSSAEMQASNDFSSFTGYSRILVQIQGESNPISLIHNNNCDDCIQLEMYEPYVFSGDDQTKCILNGNELVRDVSIITKREECRAEAYCIKSNNEIHLKGDVTFLLCMKGSFRTPFAVLKENEIIKIEECNDNEYLNLETHSEGSNCLVVHIIHNH